MGYKGRENEDQFKRKKKIKDDVQISSVGT